MGVVAPKVLWSPGCCGGSFCLFHRETNVIHYIWVEYAAAVGVSVCVLGLQGAFLTK